MKRPLLRRLLIISFFAGINVVLGIYFLTQFQIPLPDQAVALLKRFNVYPQHYQTRSSSNPWSAPQPDLESAGLLKKLNETRVASGVGGLEESSALNQAAEKLFEVYQSENFDIDQVDSKVLESILKESKYPYEWVSNNTIVGPLTIDSVISSWQGDDRQNQALLNGEFTQTGLYTQIINLNGSKVGVVVHLLAKPLPQRGQAANRVPSATAVPRSPETAPEISDGEVMQALNSYRANHGRAPLAVDENLCRYAEKRVQDLVAYGGLDGHEGFRKDFEDANNLPVGIKDYSGSRIGENLAHQYCRNMTTGESFVAQTGTALIEWCFDSSTKGHREAQLSTEFKNMCVRHGQRMYVVTFGN